MSRIGVIQANPDQVIQSLESPSALLTPHQSKHLETATAKVNGMWIDFVNLRSEVYDPDSRIPMMVGAACSN